ncbi:hypothetical protein AAMO2058_001386300 [Amorphochlora amoebiformis]
MGREQSSNGLSFNKYRTCHNTYPVFPPPLSKHRTEEPTSFANTELKSSSVRIYMDLRHGEVFQQATTINNQSTGDILSAPKSNAMDTAPTSYWIESKEPMDSNGNEQTRRDTKETEEPRDSKETE